MPSPRAVPSATLDQSPCPHRWHKCPRPVADRRCRLWKGLDQDRQRERQGPAAEPFQSPLLWPRTLTPPGLHLSTAGLTTPSLMSSGMRPEQPCVCFGPSELQLLSLACRMAQNVRPGAAGELRPAGLRASVCRLLEDSKRTVNTFRAHTAESQEVPLSEACAPGLSACLAVAGPERPRTAAAPPKPHARRKALGSTRCAPGSGLGP